MNRKVLALEWLLFWAFILVGLTVVPLFLAFLVPDAQIERGIGAFFTEYYSALFGAFFGRSRAYSLFMVVLLLLPYLLFQWVRVTYWSLQTLREK